MQETQDKQIDLWDKFQNSSFNFDTKLNVIEITQSFDTQLSWNEIFTKDYNQVKIITYSYSNIMIKKLLKLYDHVEIIIGSKKTLSGDIKTILSFELAVMKKYNELLLNDKKIKDAYISGKLSIFVTNKNINHSKIYLLSNDTTQKFCTVMGSANLSKIAWTGKQKENINISYDEDRYFIELKNYHLLKDKYAQQFTEKSLTAKSIEVENLCELPVLKEAKISTAPIIIDNYQDDSDTYVLTEYDLTKIDEALKNIKFSPKCNDNKVLIIPKDISQIKRNLIKINNKNQINVKIKNHKASIDYIQNMYIVDSKSMLEDISKEMIQNDLNCLVDYFNSFDNFYGNIKHLKKEYWKLLIWSFLAPFMGDLYVTGYLENDYPQALFPLYALLSGDTNAGKSEFIKYLEKLTFGKEYGLLSNIYFTKKKTHNLQFSNERFLLSIDDITNDGLDKKLSQITKSPFPYPNTKIRNISPVIFTMNESRTSLQRAFSKRIFMINQNSVALSPDDQIKLSRPHNKLKEKTTNNFYLYFIKLMIPKVNSLLDAMANSSIQKPDIFTIASQTIIKIFEEFGSLVHINLEELEFADFMGEKHLAKNAILLLENQYKSNPDSFIVDKSNDKLVVKYSLDIPAYKREQYIKHLCTELPTSCLAKRKSATPEVEINLSEIQKHLKVNLNTKSFLNKLLCKLSINN